MASDVEDLITFYADLPSIFENNSSFSIESSYNAIVTDVNTEKSYQPMFGSFLFANSDPLSRAAFVASSSPSSSIEMETAQEQLIHDCTLSDEDNISSSIQRTPSSPPPLAPAEDMDDDEDDFDGIPIQHASSVMKKKLNGDSDSISNDSEHDRLFDEFIHQIENSYDDNDMDDESFLNGFTDEQQETTATGLTLFKDIPDIDDLNEHEEDDQVPFDHMDMFDQSDSIRSSSPDSLLSSSHLQDDDDDDDEVAQWNDDLILGTTSSNINADINQENSPVNLHIHPFDQVNFIDSSRSNSQCSNVSLQLGTGYGDPTRKFLSDDGLMTSSDSDDDDNNNNDNTMKLDCDTFNRDQSEDICLQVNLDDHRSLSPFSKSNSTRSSSPIPDQTPIVDIDEDNNESKTLSIAPIAVLDDDDDEDDLQTFISDQPVLPYITSTIKNLLELKTEKRQNDIIHDIINMRQIINEKDHDDEFIAVMHNPKIFEQVLYDHENNDDNQKESELVKETNSVTSTFRSSKQLSIDNKIKKESFEHHQNIHQTSSSLESNTEKNFISSPSSPFSTRKTTNKSSATAVNHLTKEGQQSGALVNVVNTTDILSIKQKDEQLYEQQTNTSNNIDVKQFTNNKNHYQIMNTDNESDDDSELLKTLSQLHDIIKTTQSSEEMNQVEPQLSTYSPDINQEKNPFDSSSENRIINGSKTELLNKKKQLSSQRIPSSSYVIDTITQPDEEQEEKDDKKNVIFHKNHNNDEGDVKQKGKYEKREEEKKPTTVFSLTSTTSPILFNDDSHSSIVSVDPDTSSSLLNLLLLSSNDRHDSTLFSNQSITDDSQIANTKSNMNNLPNDDDTQQTTSNLFDPFAPTTTTTKMFDEIFVDPKITDGKEFDISSNSNPTQPLANYNFDDLWNQSISHIESSDNHENKANNNTWNAFLNNNEQTNPFNDTTTIPTSNITWESLFGEEQQKEEEDKNDLKHFLHWIINHLDDSESLIPFTSTQNLESIVKDIQMSTMPFEPMLSPPLHVDHTVSNPLINAIHHELFPIDELEQPNVTQGRQSMTLYEEDEEEEENKKSLSFDEEVKPIVDKLVAEVLQSALTEVNESYLPVEHFVDQILAQAIFEVYHEYTTELSELKTNDTIPTENLASIISWHDQTKATNKQLLDPFDQQFDSVWSSHFQAPDDTTNENLFETETKNVNDPWSIAPTKESNQNFDPMMFFSKTLDDSELFSSTNKIQQIEDDEPITLSEYLPPPLLTNPSNATTTAANNLMKYTLTAPVIDDSGDDSSILEDDLVPQKNESPVATNTKIDEQLSEIKDTTSTEQKPTAHLSHFEAFASDQPLNSPEIELKFTDLTAQFDDEFNESSPAQQSTEDNTPWTSIEKPLETVRSSGIGDDEPWELEDSGEDKLSPVPTTSRLSPAFNDNEYVATEKVTLQKNFFSDSFNPDEEIESSVTKTVRFNDNIQSIRSPTPPTINLESSTSTDSDEIEIDDIAPNFETNNDQMEASFVTIDETDIKNERPYESGELSPRTVNTRLENEELSSSFNDQSNTSNDDIPLKSSLSSANTETQYKINLRSESEITPTIQTTTTDTKLRGNTDTQLVQPFESGILIFTICI